MPARFGKSWAVSLLVLLICSCQPIRTQVKNIDLTADGTKLISLRGAGNEWVDFIVQTNGLAEALHRNVQLRLVGLDRLGPDARWYQLDRNSTALVPMQSDSSSAEISDLAGGNEVWVDLHIPTGTQMGDYHGSCQVLVDNRFITDIPLALHVYGFSLPDEPSLTIAGEEVTSAGLRRLYPRPFAGFGSTIDSAVPGESTAIVVQRFTADESLAPRNGNMAVSERRYGSSGGGAGLRVGSEG